MFFSRLNDVCGSSLSGRDQSFRSLVQVLYKSILAFIIGEADWISVDLVFDRLKVIHVRIFKENLVRHTWLQELTNLEVELVGADKTSSSCLFEAKFLGQEVSWRVKLIIDNGTGSSVLLAADYHCCASSIAASLVVGIVLSVAYLMKNRFSQVDESLSFSQITCFEFEL